MSLAINTNPKMRPSKRERERLRRGGGGGVCVRKPNKESGEATTEWGEELPAMGLHPKCQGGGGYFLFIRPKRCGRITIEKGKKGAGKKRKKDGKKKGRGWVQWWAALKSHLGGTGAHGLEKRGEQGAALKPKKKNAKRCESGIRGKKKTGPVPRR